MFGWTADYQTSDNLDDGLREMMTIDSSSSQLAPGDAPVVVAIYKPFFLAGILSVLTSGCLLGAVALWGISQRQSYTATGWTPYVLAHANSQLFGWVGLFVMGFALQLHPPRQSRARLYHRLAYASLTLILAGIVLRFFAEPLIGSNGGTWLPVGILSAVLQAAAVLLFVANTGMTRAKVIDSGTGRSAGLPWQSLFVFASLGWWLAVSAAEPVIFALSHQPDRTGNILFVAKWFMPYREAQFLGFVVNMIFGVGLARFTDLFGTPAANKKAGLTGFALWNAGLIVRMIGWLVYFGSDMQPEAGRLYLAGGMMLALGAMCLVASSRSFEFGSTAAGGTVARKFMRAALGWLLFTGVMLILEPVHLRAIGAPFSHAYIGAIRHAVTVGFISQMILGVSMRLVPRLRNCAEMSPIAAWAVFALLNVGNAVRVACEVATDYTPGAFRLMGITGFIELTALVIWGAYLGSVLLRTAGLRRPETGTLQVTGEPL